jgi:hypothetical protein
VNRLPFDFVVTLANQLADAAAFCETPEDRILLWDYYERYIEECGWTEKEYDEELLKRINASWATNHEQSN